MMDESLLNSRQILDLTEDTESSGYNARLSCGHKIWFARRPTGTEMICIECLDLLIQQSHERERA